MQRLVSIYVLHTQLSPQIHQKKHLSTVAFERRPVQRRQALRILTIYISTFAA